MKSKLNKTLKQRDKLQKVIKLLLNNFSSCKKKVDELAKRLNTKEKSMESDIKLKYKLKNQLKKKKIENDVLIKGLQKLSNALSSNCDTTQQEEDIGIENLVDSVQQIVNKIVSNPKKESLQEEFK